MPVTYTQCEGDVINRVVRVISPRVYITSLDEQLAELKGVPGE